MLKCPDLELDFTQLLIYFGALFMVFFGTICFRHSQYLKTGVYFFTGSQRYCLLDTVGVKEKIITFLNI